MLPSTDPGELEGVFNFFTTKALFYPWHIYDHLTIHLNPDILIFIATKWAAMADAPLLRAGFLSSLLSVPGKRFPADLKQPADKLITIALEDPHPYVKVLAHALRNWIMGGYIDTSSVLQVKELENGLSTFRKNLFKTRFSPKLLVFVSHKARKNLPVSSDMSPVGAEPPSPSALSATNGFQIKPEYTISSLKRRLEKYGIDTHHSPTLPSVPRGSMAGKQSMVTTPLGLRKRSTVLGSFSRQTDRPISHIRGMSGTDSDTPIKAKGFQKKTKIMMIDIEQTVDIEKTKLDAQKKLEDDVQAEKLRKNRERDEAAQAKRTAKEMLDNERRVKRARLEEERRLKLEEKDRERLEKKKRLARVADELGGNKRRQNSNDSDGEVDDSDGDDPSFSDKQENSKHDIALLDRFSYAALTSGNPDASVPTHTSGVIEIRPPPVPAKIAFEDVVYGSENLSEEDSRLIQDFLLGRYISQKNVVKEIKLSEHVFDDVNGVRKRESMWIILDYDNCKWRKVKRTVRINVIVL
ncbi:hypothetical protein BASA61_010054 [Batrachochytrium salamandrivorans]|nr:hypothetical protein BASA62_008206 [Batrachochytrium salamandrivorans]KAH6573327.1 hypothetical protein BASA60_006101 [Batrachochytrium salamandrivorans]KAH6579744.1 hypothetical protein BASA61_010054 [Batrachochytrium salamandrivorans]KAJ1334313.1 hypothetical protein BSLG_008148 [Batrachochytrium salamandrivorans]